MANFDQAYAITMKIEGGYSNDKNDTGGETYKGISRVNNPNWGGWLTLDAYKKAHGLAGIDAALAAIPELEASVKAFYKRAYWDVNKLDSVVNQAIANELFDIGVNGGTGVAAKLLQHALNLCNNNQLSWPDIAEDGQIGNDTLSKLNNAPRQLDIFNTINILMGARYVMIMEHNPTQEKFWRSWLSRVHVNAQIINQ